MILEELKFKWGTKAIKCNSKKTLINRKKIFAPFFKKEKVKVTLEGDKVDERWLVYTPYPKTVSELRCLLRGQDPETVKHIISDDHGKGYYKMSMTQITKEDTESNASKMDIDNDLE